MFCRFVVTHTKHVFDHHLMRQSDTEGKAIVTGRSSGQRLLGKCTGMPRIGWGHRRTKPNAGGLAANQRQGRDGIVGKNVRDPDMVQTRCLNLLTQLHHGINGFLGAVSSDHCSDTHPLFLWLCKTVRKAYPNRTATQPNQPFFRGQGFHFFCTSLPA